MFNIFKQLSHWLGSDAGNESADAAAHSGHLLASLLNMAWFVEARDPYTGGHLWRVSRYARLLSESAGLGNAAAAGISLGGFLHDLGKVGVSDAILRKPDRPFRDTYDAAGLAAARERIEALVERIREGDFAPTTAPHRDLCHDCPARRRLCPHPVEITGRDLEADPKA